MLSTERSLSSKLLPFSETYIQQIQEITNNVRKFTALLDRVHALEDFFAPRLPYGMSYCIIEAVIFAEMNFSV